LTNNQEPQVSLNPGDLAQFTGTAGWHKWSPLFPKMTLTDGARYVAEHGGENGAYWLMDAIASHQPELLKNPRLQDAQFWTLSVNPDKTAKLTCVEDSDCPPCVEQHIDYTDFDLNELRLYCMPLGDGAHYTILLPSEY
jgi:hypothetical protein